MIKNVTRFLEEELKLKVNITKSEVRRPNDPDTKFLGFGFYKDPRAYLYKAKPHAKSIKALRDKIKYITSRSNGWNMDKRLNSLRNLFGGWFNYFKLGTIKTLSGVIDSYTRFRLRIVIWKQWKKVSTKYRALIKLGIDKSKAWEWANTRKKYVRVAKSFIMCRSVTNKVLEQRGFLPMETLYISNSI